MNRPPTQDMSVEWQNFFRDLYNRVGGESAPTNLDLMERSGGLDQLDSRLHSDLEGLDEDDHPVYLKKSKVTTGSSIFGSTSGVMVSFGPADSRGYFVVITPITADPSNIGAVSVHAKREGSFTVYNSGVDSTSEFEWMVIENE